MSRDKITKESINLYSNCSLYVKAYARIKTRLGLLLLPDILKLLPENKTIIDLGCGYGLLANYLSLRLKNARIIGLDLNPKRIEVAQQTVKDRKNIEFLLKDIRKIELPSCSGVVLADVLHHLPMDDQNSLLKAIYNKLDKDGVLVILEVNPSEKPIWKYWLSYLSDIIFYSFSDKCHYRGSREMKKKLFQIGFAVKIITDQKSPLFSRIIYICQKK